MGKESLIVLDLFSLGNITVLACLAAGLLMETTDDGAKRTIKLRSLNE